ncbi:hypothetical protein HPB50_007413 [Hyalomma asiaticum]|uniref:Uncharacterized protein n=1 Tax=Hyalomma asiaticum TaxID=266040 RepID=A0ACB7TDA6_HYAAI|nr:hypothetical protein HPB50_007413 [Hyalomma asiaticum]
MTANGSTVVCANTVLAGATQRSRLFMHLRLPLFCDSEKDRSFIGSRYYELALSILHMVTHLPAMKDNGSPDGDMLCHFSTSCRAAAPVSE